MISHRDDDSEGKMVLLDQAADILRRSASIVFFTGAGMSAESGIPTYLDKLPRIWSKYDPRELETAKAFKADPALVWGWYLWRRSQVAKASPNPAHLAIARLADSVAQVAVITQNIDDFHERSGSVNVVHLHGHLKTPKCYACHRPDDLTPVDDDEMVGGLIEPPRCKRCNGRMRPAVVWYGENLPGAVWKEATRLITACDLLISVGTSGQVMPAASLPAMALAAGASIIHINTDSVSSNSSDELLLMGTAAEVLPKLIELAFPQSRSARNGVERV